MLEPREIAAALLEQTGRLRAAAARRAQGRHHGGPDARADRPRALHHESQLGKDGLRRRRGGARGRCRSRARERARRAADAGGVRRVDVETAEQMYEQGARRDRRRPHLHRLRSRFRLPAARSSASRRSNARPPRWSSRWCARPIRSRASRRLPRAPFTVGFAAETHDVAAHARDKLERKRIDMIAANQVGPDCGFDRETNALTVFWTRRRARARRRRQRPAGAPARRGRSPSAIARRARVKKPSSRAG